MKNEERMVEVLAYVACGWPCREIAEELGDTEAAVKKRLVRLYRRLGARNAAHAVAIAAVEGLLTPADLAVAADERRQGWVRDRQEE